MWWVGLRQVLKSRQKNNLLPGQQHMSTANMAATASTANMAATVSTANMTM
jgi:hypothetical protein